MREISDVRNHRLALDILTYGKGKRCLRILELLTRKKISEKHGFRRNIGNFDTDGALSGNGSLDPYIRCR